ncbi:3,4-dihydroxy-2-butanone-4-phosphate synthase [Pseudooceanicola sp.]|uniref:3,4-dihydroxy-2-butanone-4-phosphate synthase n=1 Tax=Pseudooceanicola sp. TaxID=1914328 RepID=UPI0035129B60
MVTPALQRGIGALQDGRFLGVVGALDIPAFLLRSTVDVTAADLNFLAAHAKGLISLALSRERAAALRLSPQPRMGRFGLGHGYLQSIEAREGISTGISAADRARTIRVATDGGAAPGDIVTPGHVFPICALPEGIELYCGAAEVALELMARAGLPDSAVLCAILDRAGRLPDEAAMRDICNTLGLGLLHTRDLQ